MDSSKYKSDLSVENKTDEKDLLDLIEDDEENKENEKEKEKENKEEENIEKSESIIDRFYRSLFELMSLKDVLVSKNIKEYLKLIMSCMVNDKNNTRILSMMKRLLQWSLMAEPQIISCILIIISHVLHSKKGLWKYVENLTFSEETETFVKRDPRYQKENSLVELLLLNNHYHPTIRKWSTSIIENHRTETIIYNGDPLLDFSLVNFLNKFITKNPKLKNKKSGKKDNNNEKENEEGEVGESIDFITKFSDVNKESESIVIKDKERKKKKKKVEEDADSDLEDYADKVVEDEIDRLDGGDVDDEDDFISDNEEMEDEEDFEEEEDMDSIEDKEEDDDVPSGLELAESDNEEEIEEEKPKKRIKLSNNINPKKNKERN